MSTAEDFLSLPVVIYLAGVVLGQVIVVLSRRHAEHRTARRRQAAGLDDSVLVDHRIKLETLRRWSAVDALVLIGTVAVLPFVIAMIWSDKQEAVAITFLGLVIWVLVSATDVAKAFLGGVAFRAYVGLRRPFQVGDRVTLMGHSGKVEAIDPFFITLSTPDDQQVSVPTSALWSQPLVSANAGDRASLVAMTFHLAPVASVVQRKTAEDTIWRAIQASTYWDFDKPMQIFVEQQPDEIQLTAKAYVASTYNEPVFRSEVHQAFLDVADREGLPLAFTDRRQDTREARAP